MNLLHIFIGSHFDDIRIVNFFILMAYSFNSTKATAEKFPKDNDIT